MIHCLVDRKLLCVPKNVITAISFLMVDFGLPICPLTKLYIHQYYCTRVNGRLHSICRRLAVLCSTKYYRSNSSH